MTSTGHKEPTPMSEGTDPYVRPIVPTFLFSYFTVPALQVITAYTGQSHHKSKDE